MSDTYQLRLLGPVEVKKDEETVRGFVSRKALAILGYLAVQPRPVSRIELVDLLWSDKSEARGRGNLSRVLNNLYTLLPNCIEADYHTVRLFHKDTCWLDVAVFDKLTARQDIGALTNFADLYRGEFMADIYLDDCPAFEAWLVAERERWHRRVV